MASSPLSPRKQPAVQSYFDGLEVVPPGEGLESTTPLKNNKYNSTLSPHLQHSYPEVVPSDGTDKERVTDENRPRWPQPGSGPRWGQKMSRKTFWFLVAIAVLVVIIAIVLGVAIGMTRSKSNSNQSSSLPDTAPTTSLSSSSTITSQSSGSTSKTSSISSSSTTTAQNAYPTTALKINCPALNGTTAVVNTSSTVSPSETFTFNLFCNVNFGAGQDSAVKNTSSLQDCMQSCADLSAEGATCVGVVWDSVMNLALVPPKNCFMKGSTSGFGYTGTANISAAALIDGNGGNFDGDDDPVSDDPPS